MRQSNSSELQKLSQMAVEKASSLGLTFTFAESCTGGLLAKSITDIAGASSVFLGSIVSYSDTVKASVLSVSRDTLATHTAVSAECAAQMASGALSVIPSNIAISVTGYAGPEGGTKEDPLGTVYFGIAKKSDEVITIKKIFCGTRCEVREAAAIEALYLLLNVLTEE